MANDDTQAELYGGPYEGHPSVFLRIEEGLKRNPNGTAVIVAHQSATHLSELDPNSDSASKGSACLSWTYLQLHRSALTLARGMLAHGVRTGSTLVTLIPNGIESLLMFYVAAVLKLTLAPLDAGALTRPRREELVNFMRTLTPMILVVPNAADADAVDEAVKEAGIQAPVLKVRTSDQEAMHDDWVDISSLARQGLDHGIDEQTVLNEAREDDPERVALIVFTSGTSSGRPKGCPRRAGGLAQLSDVHTWGATIGPTTKFLFSTANFRVIAPSVTICVWRKGGTIVMPAPAFAPKPVLDAIEKHGITDLLLLPAQVHALAGHVALLGTNVDTVRMVYSGGDIVTRDLLLKMSCIFPKANVAVGHGMTEGGALFAWHLFGASLKEIPCYGEIAPLGRVNKGARIRIWDHEKSRIASKGEPGELHICNVGTIRHYLNNEHEDSFYDDEIGRWFKTGDLGLVTHDDVVYILGRMKDTIKRAGIPITPAALESSIGKYTGFLTAVIGIPSSTLGQEPFAVLQDFGGKTEAQIQQHVFDLFGTDYQLAGAASLRQLGLEAFPLNATGKVMKIELQKTISDYLSRQG